MENGQTVHFIRSFQSINFPSEQGVLTQLSRSGYWQTSFQSINFPNEQGAKAEPTAEVQKEAALFPIN